MSVKRTIVGEVTIEYLKKYKGRPNRQIAKLLHQNEPELFSSEENARACIRYYTGAMGGDARKRVSKEVLNEFQNHNQNYMDWIKLPEGDSKDFTPYKLPASSKRIGIIGDLQIPFHSKSAIEIALEWLDKKGIDTLILNGDIMDAYQLSKYCKDPRKKDFWGEIQIAKAFLDGLCQKDWHIIWKDGNHEVRYYHYMMQKAPELLNIPQFHFPEIMEFGAKGITYVENKVLIECGHLAIGHGDEYKGGSGGVNPARSMYLKSHTNYLVGHFHRTSEHSEPNMMGKLTSTWSTGCLSGLRPEFLPYNKWNHGFAFVERDGEQFEVYNKKILKGKVY